MFSRCHGQCGWFPKSIPLPTIRLRRQSHSQWGCSQTPSLKFHHPTAFPVPSSALLITPAHINLQHSCLSSLHLNGSSMRAGSFVFYFLLYPQWWKQCLSHNRHWMKESKLLHLPCQRLFWQWAAPIGQFWANEMWGETCQKRKASPSPARYEHRSFAWVASGSYIWSGGKAALGWM